MLSGLDNALIFTATKESCLAACLNEVLSHFNCLIVVQHGSKYGTSSTLRINELIAVFFFFIFHATEKVRVPISRVQLHHDKVPPERARPSLGGRVRRARRRSGRRLLRKPVSQE